MWAEIHKVRRALSTNFTLERDMVALGLIPLDRYRQELGYFTIGYVHPVDPSLPTEQKQYSLTEIVLSNPNHRRISFPVDKITSKKDHSTIPESILERLFIYQQLGGTEEEFWALLQYKKTRANGEKALTLPAGVGLVRVYKRGQEPNPRQEGLMEVHLEGTTAILDRELVHRLPYHHLHPPLASTGLVFDRISLGMLSGLDPSIVERAERAYQKAHHLN